MPGMFDIGDVISIGSILIGIGVALGSLQSVKADVKGIKAGQKHQGERLEGLGREMTELRGEVQRDQAVLSERIDHFRERVRSSYQQLRDHQERSKAYRTGRRQTGIVDKTIPHEGSDDDDHGQHE